MSTEKIIRRLTNEVAFWKQSVLRSVYFMGRCRWYDDCNEPVRYILRRRDEAKSKYLCRAHGQRLFRPSMHLTDIYDAHFDDFIMLASLPYEQKDEEPADDKRVHD